MIKRIIILAIAGCFFLENIVMHIVKGADAAYCMENPGEKDGTEKEDGAKKDKKEDFTVTLHYKYYLLRDSLKNRFYIFEEPTYFQYAPEINLPPPDAV